MANLDYSGFDIPDDELPSSANQLDYSGFDIPDDELPQEQSWLTRAFTKPENIGSEQYQTSFEEGKQAGDVLGATQSFDTNLGFQQETNAGVLKETMLPSFITGRNFTDESMQEFTIAQTKELMKRGLNPQQAKIEVYKTLEGLGATPEDLNSLSASSRGIRPGNQVFGALAGQAPAVAKDILKKDIQEPAVTGLARTGMKLGYIAGDVADTALAIGSLVVDNEEAIKDNQAYMEKLDNARAYLDGLEQSYKDNHGGRSFVTDLTANGLEAASVVYNPSSIAKLAFAEAGLAYGAGRAEGFSKTQSGAQAIVIGAATGAVAKLAELALPVMKEYPMFKTIDDLPSNYKKQVRKLQEMNGWTDEEATMMIKNYATGLEDGNLMAKDAIRVLAQQHTSATGKDLFEEVIYSDLKAARTMISEIDARANNILKVVNKDSELGKIIIRNKKSYQGKSAINWNKVIKDAEKAGIPDTGPVMERIKQYDMSHMDYDTAVFNEVLIRRGVRPDGNILSDITEGAKSISKYLAAKQVSKALGTTILMPFNPVVRMINAATRATPTVRNALKRTIKESLDKGLTGRSLIKELKKTAPNVSDADIKSMAKAVDDFVKGSSDTTPPINPGGGTPKPNTVPSTDGITVQSKVEPVEVDINAFEADAQSFKDTLRNVKPLSKEGKDAVRGIRNIALDHTGLRTAYDGWIAAGNKGAPSSFFIRNAHKVPVESVQNYYKLNPAKLGGEDAGKFGIPKAIRIKYGIEQNYVDMPEGYMAHSFAPGVVGLEQDEDGNITYDPVMGIAAMGAIGLGRKYGAGKDGLVYFVSKAKNVVDKLPNKGTIRKGDFATFLKKRGVKEDEITSLGVKEFEASIPGKSISFKEAKAFMNANAGEDLSRYESNKYVNEYLGANVPNDNGVSYSTLRTSDLMYEQGYNSKHFNQPELYHTRSTVGDLNGKKTFFVQEVQSDLHQAAKLVKGPNARNWVEKAIEDQIFEAAKEGSTRLAIPLGKPVGLNFRSDKVANNMYSETGTIRKALEKIKAKHGGNIEVVTPKATNEGKNFSYAMDELTQGAYSGVDSFNDMVQMKGSIKDAFIDLVNKYTDDLEEYAYDFDAFTSSNNKLMETMTEFENYIVESGAKSGNLKGVALAQDILRNPSKYKDFEVPVIKPEQIKYLTYEWPKGKPIEIELY